MNIRVRPRPIPVGFPLCPFVPLVVNALPQSPVLRHPSSVVIPQSTLSFVPRGALRGNVLILLFLLLFLNTVHCILNTVHCPPYTAPLLPRQLTARTSRAIIHALHSLFFISKELLHEH